MDPIIRNTSLLKVIYRLPKKRDGILYLVYHPNFGVGQVQRTIIDHHLVSFETGHRTIQTSALQLVDICPKGYFWPLIKGNKIRPKYFKYGIYHSPDLPLSYKPHPSDLLDCVGYRAGEFGLPYVVRRRILDCVFHNKLPNLYSEKYMNLWGEPESNQRLKRIRAAIRHPTKYTQLSTLDEREDVLYIIRSIRDGNWQVNSSL
ncbi:hypothetical protein MNB_SUP05-7-177 [hydrothermal vent metagenome]|uniref:Uncharacterized protein n=1 Tax=hydrothermal vent metagenome TaxID=652676 RepID=A0A1W1DR45_9ZZZZ